MDSSQGNKEFIQNILKYRHGNSLKTDGDKIAVRGLGHTFTLPRLPNEQSYPVTSPDCILPMSPAFPVMTYAISNTPAAVAYQGTIIALLSWDSLLKASGKKHPEMQLWPPYSAFSPQITQINTDKIAIPINNPWKSV